MKREESSSKVVVGGVEIIKAAKTNIVVKEVIMAAGSADAFSATPRGFGCYDRELISAAADNLWSSSVVATASTGASWVDEVHSSDPIEKRIEEIKRKFHRGRQLQIKQLPREVTEEEIRELLSEWEVQSVLVQSGAARVALCSPEMLEDWDRNAVFTLRGQRISIVPSPTEMLLCVGRLPMSYSDQQFHNLIAAYGEVKRYFLMISEKTGESKGYGFVEYVTKESALQAKNGLDGKQILDFTAVCDWLDSSHVTVRSLHAKCLYIDHLPSNYRDMGEFRRIFSTIVNPPYCQIALRNGCPQDWGLVEFINEDDSERTQQALDGYLLHGHRIRISYYIPGVRAINLYLKLLNDGGSNKGKSALLPDPPAPAVFQQLQSLAKQNPVFAQNLQAIIMQQIQDLQKGKGINGEHGKRQPYHKGSQVPYGSPSSNQTNSNLIKNAHQTALTLLLASQMQQNGSSLGPGGSGGSGQLSPNSANSTSLQNQQLLAALQAMSKGNTGGGGLPTSNMGTNGSLCNSDQFMNGIPNMNNGHNLSTLLGLASANNMSGLSQMDQQPSGGISHGFFQPSGLLMSPVSSTGSNCSNTPSKDDQWSSFKSNKNSSGFGSNGIQKSPLLPSPSGLSSPTLDVPMDTGMNPSKSPGGDSLQAVWYSLFGQPSSPDSQSASGSTSPLFMKTPMSSSNSSSASRNVDQLFGLNSNNQTQPPIRSTPPGFCGPNGRNMNGMNGDFQEALNNLLSNPQNLCHILGGNSISGNESSSGAKSPIPFSSGSHQNTFQQGMHNGLLQQNMSNLPRHSPLSGGMDQGGVSSAILDLLMQSMKTDPPPASDSFGGMKHNTWSSGLSTPPSPIGNNRSFHNGHGNGHHGAPSMPQRSGSNGSSEMSSSSPRSPSYSPFPRSSNKGILESGNGNVSPTPTPWSNPVLGSPPSSGGFGAPHHLPTHHSGNTFPGVQSRNIWGNHGLSPGANSMNNNANLMNAMGQKRKNHESGIDVDGFLPTPMSINNGISHVVLGASPAHNTLQPPPNLCNPNDLANPMSNHYADTYFKKKKKN